MKIARFQGWDSQIDTKYHSDSQFYDSRIDFILYTYVTYVYSVYQIHQRCRWLSSNFQVQELTHRVKSGKVRRVNWDAWHRFVFFASPVTWELADFCWDPVLRPPNYAKGTCPRRSRLVIQREVLLGLSQAKNRAQVDIWFKETFADNEMRPESGLRRPSNLSTDVYWKRNETQNSWTLRDPEAVTSWRLNLAQSLKKALPLETFLCKCKVCCFGCFGCGKFFQIFHGFCQRSSRLNFVVPALLENHLRMLFLKRILRCNLTTGWNFTQNSTLKLQEIVGTLEV